MKFPVFIVLCVLAAASAAAQDATAPNPLGFGNKQDTAGGNLILNGPMPGAGEDGNSPTGRPLPQPQANAPKPESGLKGDLSDGGLKGDLTNGGLKGDMNDK